MWAIFQGMESKGLEQVNKVSSFVKWGNTYLIVLTEINLFSLSKWFPGLLQACWLNFQSSGKVDSDHFLVSFIVIAFMG